MENYSLTISQASNQIKEGKLTPTELLESCLNRIEKIEPLIDAWVTFDKETAKKTAEELTREVALGKIRSPLHGIPVGIKDIYDTKGLRTTMGSPIYKDHIPEADSLIVTKLKNAGAIIIGKTQTTEFAYLDPAPTKNPWAQDHTPGGSSSGSAAAVSSQMCPLGFGSQTAGSVIRPASFCGVVGVKPTYDLLSREGVFPLAWSLDHVGYMTRNVKDAAITLDVLTGSAISTQPMMKPPRLCYPDTYFQENADGEVNRNLNEAVERIWRRGADIEPFRLPEVFKVIHSVVRVIMAAESATIHREQFKKGPESYRPLMRGQIASGLLIPSVTYLQAQRIRHIFINEMLKVIEGYDAVITPSAPTPALPGLQSTGDASFNSPWSLAGFPSITIPSGLTIDGLPQGLQFITKPHEEAKLFAVARWCEDKLGSIGDPSLKIL